MKRFIGLIMIFSCSVSSYACTTFLLSRNGEYIFGRNYDWVTENGMVMVNARSVNKTSATVPDGKPVTWVSLFGSISFNQYGKEFPTGGMNEKGLVVELMWLDQTRFPGEDKRPALNILQWIQYQLDRSSTVEEVISSDAQIRISNFGAPIHYLVADASGKAATIEFLNGKMVVHKDEDLALPVLTNSTYSQSIESLKKKKEISGSEENSLNRFSTACSMVQKFKEMDGKESAVEYAFSILNSVAQGSATKWSIVYDITNRQVNFITHDYQDRKTFSFSDFNFSCTDQAIAFDMNSKAKGNISALFLPLTSDRNRKLIEKSAEESKSQVKISKSGIDESVKLYKVQKCK